MKIGLNAQYLTREKYAGPEIYTLNIFKALLQADSINEYVLYFENEPSKELLTELIGTKSNVEYKVLKKMLSWTQVSLALELLIRPVDVFFTTIHTMPIFHRKNTKIVAMIHGLEYVYQDNSKNMPRRLVSGQTEKYVASHADHIIVPSNATKEALLGTGWAGDSNLTVVPEGVDDSFYKRSEGEINNSKLKYKISSDRYLFFISTIEPRKNIPRMVEGFSKALGKGNALDDVNLIIAGKKGWDFKESLEAPKKYGIKNRVQFIGRVDQEDVAPLMSGAPAYISCSYEEGFGLPLLEAMACEVPTIVSDIGAYRETGLDLPYFVDSLDPESISSTILNVLGSPVDINRVADAKKRASEFSWEKAAKSTLKVFEDTVKGI